MPLPVRMVKRTRKDCAPVYYWRRVTLGRDGKSHNQCRTLGSDYDTAMTEYAKLEADPPPVEPEPVVEPVPVVTVEMFARRWLAEYASTHRTPRGQASAAQRFNDYLYPLVGAKPLADLKATDLQWLNAKLAEARPFLEAPGRKRRAGAVGLVARQKLFQDIRAMLGYAVDACVLDRLPWKKNLLPKVAEGRPDPLTDLELAEVLRAAPERWKPVFTVMAATGLRWGETRSLAWKDVHEKPYPHLKISESHFGPTKSRKGRDVPLMWFGATEVLESLERPAKAAGPVFPWLPQPTAWINRYIKRQSWVKDFHLHRLRHTFATRYLEAGGTLEALQIILGHSTITQTECYGRLRSHIVQAEAARINRVDMARVDVATIVATTVLEPSQARNSL